MSKARIPTSIEQLTHAQRECYGKLTPEWQSVREIACKLGLPARYNAGQALNLNRMVRGGLIESSHDAGVVAGVTVYRLKQP